MPTAAALSLLLLLLPLPLLLLLAQLLFLLAAAEHCVAQSWDPDPDLAGSLGLGPAPDLILAPKFAPHSLLF